MEHSLLPLLVLLIETCPGNGVTPSLALLLMGSQTTLSDHLHSLDEAPLLALPPTEISQRNFT